MLLHERISGAVLRRAVSSLAVVLAMHGILGAAGSVAWAADPVPVIFDTDITGDVDDVLALAMLHTLADRGACDLRAVTISKEHPLAAPFVDAVNTFYGRPDLPIGVGENLPHRESRYLQLVEEKEGDAFRYPHDIGVSAAAEQAVPLIRRTLEHAEDRSVVIIQVGLATNLAALLDEPGAKSLIEQKVRRLCVMGGAFETINADNRYLEANVRNHVASMQTLAGQWPDHVPVSWSGFEIGIAAPYPRESIAHDFGYREHHIVREAYLLHSGPDHDRPTWDLTSVLDAVSPDRGFFGRSPGGRVSVDDDGFTRFTPSRGKAIGRDRFLTMTAVQAARVQEALVQLVSQPPRR